jgi:aminopeptidase
MTYAVRLILAAGATMFIAGCGAGDNPVRTSSGSATATAGFDLEGAAHQVVTRSAQVQEGDRVVISGSPDDIELLENIATHVRRLGAHPLVVVWSDRLTRRTYDDVPEQFDSQRDVWAWAMADMADVVITIAPGSAVDLLAELPMHRVIARRQANAGLNEHINTSGMRTVEVGNGLYPSESLAQRFGMSQQELARLFWEGVQADPTRLMNSANAIADVFGTGRIVHVTHPNGTDITFRIDGQTPGINNGVVPPARPGAPRGTWLPAGEVYTVVVPGSANGRLVIDRTLFQGIEVRDLTVTVESGRLTAMTSPSDLSALRAAYDAAPPERELLSVFDVGINPGVASQRVVSWVPAGMATFGFGSNLFAGGDVTIDWLLPLHQPGTTVRVDDTIIIENGVLMK